MDVIQLSQAFLWPFRCSFDILEVYYVTRGKTQVTRVQENFDILMPQKLKILYVPIGKYQELLTQNVFEGIYNRYGTFIT